MKKREGERYGAGDLDGELAGMLRARGGLADPAAGGKDINDDRRRSGWK